MMFTSFAKPVWSVWKTFHPPLQPIPVGGPFHRVCVDVLQLPLTERGNKYVSVC